MNLRFLSVMTIMFATPMFANSADLVGATELSEFSAKKVANVPELGSIVELAKRAGLRVFLFGGTAEAWIQYNRWDLLRQHGDSSYPAGRFLDELDQIILDNQDFDVVVTRSDGEPETEQEISAFQAALAVQLPDFKVEVRGLRTSMQEGRHQSLVDNENYANQDYDTGSIGLVELTRPPDGLSVHDFLNFDSPKSVFLQDAAAGRIRFVRVDTHAQTAAFQKGERPEIFEAIRFLTKYYQYDLSTSRKSRKNVYDIINEWNPEETFDSEKMKKLVSQATKMIANAANKEKLFSFLATTKLGEKLIQFMRMHFPNDNTSDNSLITLLKRLPMPSRPGVLLAKDPDRLPARPRTLAELGVTYFTHETSAQGYEDITWNPQGHPALFASRWAGVRREDAWFGDGHYVSPGKLLKSGAAVNGGGGGYLVYYKVVDPKSALEGRDFVYIPSSADGEQYVILNSSILQVAFDEISLDPISVFEDMLNPKIEFNRRYLRRIANRTWPESMHRRFLRKAMPIVRSLKPREGTLAAVFANPLSWSQPELLQNAIATSGNWRQNLDYNSNQYKASLIDALGQSAYWSSQPPTLAFFKQLMDSQDPEWIKLLMVNYFRLSPYGDKHTELLRYLLKTFPLTPDLVENAKLLLSDERWRDRLDFLRIFVERGGDLVPGQFQYAFGHPLGGLFTEFQNPAAGVSYPSYPAIKGRSILATAIGIQDLNKRHQFIDQYFGKSSSSGCEEMLGGEAVPPKP